MREPQIHIITDDQLLRYVAIYNAAMYLGRKSLTATQTKRYGRTAKMALQSINRLIPKLYVCGEKYQFSIAAFGRVQIASVVSHRWKFTYAATRAQMAERDICVKITPVDVN